MRRVGRFAVQRRGTILDVWTNYGARTRSTIWEHDPCGDAHVFCIHGRHWPEGGRGCLGCLTRWRARRP